MSETFGVVGSGTMGAGIAQVAARAGYDVVIRDVDEEFLARGMAAIDKSLQRDVDKDRLRTAEKGAIVARIKTTTDLGALGNAFIVVEAATEDLKIKSDIFRSLDQVTKPDAILASNTSSISIKKLGTGFIKCIPITLSGLRVTAPRFVIAIEAVFHAQIASTCAR